MNLRIVATIIICLTMLAAGGIMTIQMGYHATGAQSDQTTVQAGSFEGTWDTNWGKMTLHVQDSTVTGEYAHDDGRIEGTLSADGKTLTGTWTETPTRKPPNDQGRVELVLTDGGKKFDGTWGYGDNEPTHTWYGTKK